MPEGELSCGEEGDRDSQGSFHRKETKLFKGGISDVKMKTFILSAVFVKVNRSLFYVLVFSGGHRWRLPEGAAVPLRRERLIMFMMRSAALSDELLGDESIRQRRPISIRASSSDFNTILIELT